MSNSLHRHTPAHQAFLSNSNSQSLLKLVSIESVMPSDRLILCHPRLPPSIFPSIRVFSNTSAPRVKWKKDWSCPLSMLTTDTVSEQVFFTRVLDTRLLPHTVPHISRKHSTGNFHSLLLGGGSKQWASLCLPILHPSGGARSVTVTVNNFTDSGPKAQHASSLHPFPAFCLLSCL